MAYQHMGRLALHRAREPGLGRAGRAGRRRGESVCASCMLPYLLLYGCSDVSVSFSPERTRGSVWSREGLSGACGAPSAPLHFMWMCHTWCRLACTRYGFSKKDEGKHNNLSLIFVCASVLCQMSLSVRPASTLAHLERARVGPPPCPTCTDRARALFCFWHFPPGLAHSSRHRRRHRRRRPAPSYTLATRKRPVCPLRCSRCSCCRIPILAVRAAMTASRSGKWGR